MGGVAAVAIPLIVSAVGAGVSAHEQNRAQQKAAQAQAEAVKQQEAALRQKGPQAVQTSGGSAEAARRKNLLRAGMLGNIKTGRYGLTQAADTASVSLAGTGSKTALGS